MASARRYRILTTEHCALDPQRLHATQLWTSLGAEYRLDSSVLIPVPLGTLEARFGEESTMFRCLTQCSSAADRRTDGAFWPVARALTDASTHAEGWPRAPNAAFTAV